MPTRFQDAEGFILLLRFLASLCSSFVWIHFVTDPYCVALSLPDGNELQRVCSLLQPAHAVEHARDIATPIDAGNQQQA